METFSCLSFILIWLMSANSIHSAGIDCKGRGFYCNSNTTFLICVDMGNNKTSTVDDDIQECPLGSFCSNAGQFECDSSIFQYTTTSSITTTQKETETPTKKTTPLTVTTIKPKPKLTTLKDIVKTTVKSSNTPKVTKIPKTTTPRPITTKTSKVTTNSTTKSYPVTTRKTSLKPNVTTSNPICQSNKHYPDETTCHYYYVCIGKKLVKFYCPFNTVFDSNKRTCSHDLKVCSNTFQCTSIGKFGDKKVCQAYFECIRLGTRFVSLRKFCPFFMSYVSTERRCVLGPRGCSFIDDYMDQL